MELTAFAAAFLPARDARRQAVRTLATALTLGVLTQALFWRTGMGINFFLWTLIVLGAEVAAFGGGRRLPATALGAIAASVLLSFAFVFHASEWTAVVAVPVDMALLAALPFLLVDRPTVEGLAVLPSRAFGSLGRAPRATAEATQLTREALGGRSLAGIAKGMAMGVPAAGLFALLLSTDDDFRHALDVLRSRCGEAVLFATWSLFTAATSLVARGLPLRPPAPADPPAPAPYRVAELAAPAEAPVPRHGGPEAWAIVVGQVVLVFGLFVGTNLRHLFGGSAIVRAADGPTYASYLHAGVAQLLVAAALSVCLVLAGHVFLYRHAKPGAPVPGGPVMIALEATLLVLTGVTVASCAQRLAIYEEAYGATHERLGVAFVGLAILGILALTLVKVLKRSWRGHAGWTLTFLTGLAVVASAVNTDAYIARTNLARAARGKSLDVYYLSSLSRDAASVLTDPAVTVSPAIAAELAQSYSSAAPASDWRARRGLGQCRR